MSKALEAAFNAVMSRSDMPSELDPEYDRWIFEASISAYLSALAEDGWKLVPVEPTEDMARAGITVRTMQENQGYKDTDQIYRSMLAAAPALKETKP